MQICSKSYSHFFSKKIRILYIESAKTVNEMTLYELVKLTTLWTTGPRCRNTRKPWIGPWWTQTLIVRHRPSVVDWGGSCHSHLLGQNILLNSAACRGGNDRSPKPLQIPSTPTTTHKKYHISTACIIIRTFYLSQKSPKSLNSADPLKIPTPEQVKDFDIMSQTALMDCTIIWVGIFFYLFAEMLSGNPLTCSAIWKLHASWQTSFASK